MPVISLLRKTNTENVPYQRTGHLRNLNDTLAPKMIPCDEVMDGADEDMQTITTAENNQINGEGYKRKNVRINGLVNKAMLRRQQGRGNINENHSNFMVKSP